jgi:tRNA threonylcarbamoyladenosine biosynthesis protein TsaB
VILAIDTSGRNAGVALLRDGVILAERIWSAAANHTTQLLPAAQELMRSFAAQPGDLTGIGVAIGPGGFTGLRVGIATAKTLGWTLGIPLVGVSSLEALALTATGATRVLTVLDAGRGDWYWALYTFTAGKRRCVAEPQIGNPAAVLGDIKQRTTLVGELPKRAIELLKGTSAKYVESRSGPLPAVRPGATGLLATELLASGASDDPTTLAPIYLRRPAAEEKHDEQARQA